MSPLSKLLLLSCLVCAAACTVPSIEEVEEKEGPAGCDDSDHKCPANFVCYENRCIQLTSDMVCRPGTSEDCTSSGRGECFAGVRVCGAEGAFGVCESKQKPAFERCDGKDNDCDGTPDNWKDPLPLNKTLDMGSTLAAIAVRRTPDGSQDTLLVLESEAGNLVARTLAPDGTLKQGTTFPPPGAGYGFSSPSLAADGDTVAAAWVEQGFVSSSSDYRVKLTLLDGSGNRAAPQVLQFPYASLSVSRVKVAINTTHVLVAVTYAPSSTAPDATVVYTVPRGNFTQVAVLGPAPLTTTHRGGFGLDATANGTGTAFLVAFEDAGIRKTVIVKNDGSLTYASGATITQSSSTHSPFIAPLKDDPVRHVVFYVGTFVTGSTVTSQLLAAGCGDQACSSEPVVVGSADHNVESMVMARRPGMQAPESALWAWRDASNMKVLAIGTYGSSGVKEWTPLRPPGNATISEALVVMPDSTRYLAYNQLAPALAVGSASEGYLMPFCGP